MAAVIRQDIPIAENFEIIDLSGYTTDQQYTDAAAMGRQVGAGYPFSLSTQRHIDVRTFTNEVTTHSEHWQVSGATAPSAVSFGPQATYNHWLGVVANLAPGTTQLSSTAGNLDLTSLGTDALLTLALPDLPLSSLTPNACILRLSSDNGQHWTALSFATSTTPLGNGDSTATWPLSSIDATSVDLTAVTDVQLALVAPTSCTFVALALRLVDPDWIPSTVDFDNWHGELKQAIPLNGDTGVIIAGNEAIPALWRAAPVNGLDDPEPINATMGVVFNTGSQTAINQVAINLRAIGGTETSQVTLDGMLQAELNGPQPGQTSVEIVPRTMSDFDDQSMGSLDGTSMDTLDAYRTFVTESWLSLIVGWGVQPYVQIMESSTPGRAYQWAGAAAPTFANRTYYLALMMLKDTEARLQIYNVDQNTFAVQSVLFDTGLIPDSYQFTRRKGRIGWSAVLQDGDASIRSIRPHALTFAEYRSAPLNSRTPVQGARLYAHFTPGLQLWQSFEALAGHDGAITVSPDVQLDAGRALSTQSYRVNVASPNVTGQGIISNRLTPATDPVGGITDFEQVEIRLATWFPALPFDEGSSLSIALVSEDNNVIPLSIPRIVPGEWQSMVLYPPSGPLQSGGYRLQIVYEGTQPATFWVDQTRVLERAIVWEGRSDPYSAWTPFKEVVNTDGGGALFATRGTALQVRAQARRQNAVILSKPQIVPQYAQLGRPTWPEDVTVDPYALTITLSNTLSTGGPTTSLPVNPIGGNLPAGLVLRLVSGTQTQEFTLSAPAPVGSIALQVNAQTPNWAYAPNTTTIYGLQALATARATTATNALEVSTTTGLQGVIAQLGTLAAGTYTVGASLRGNAGGEGIQFVVGNNTGPPVLSETLTTTPTRYTTSFTADGINPCFVCIRSSGSGSMSWFLDQVIVVAGTGTTYFDGDSPGGSWQGNRGNSISQYIAPGSSSPPILNYITNPSFEYDTVGQAPVGWLTSAPTGWTHLASGATALVSTSSSGGYAYIFNGAASLPTNNIIDYLWSFGDGTAGSGPVVEHAFPSTNPPGTSYSTILTIVDIYGTQSSDTVVTTI